MFSDSSTLNPKSPNPPPPLPSPPVPPPEPPEPLPLPLPPPLEPLPLSDESMFNSSMPMSPLAISFALSAPFDKLSATSLAPPLASDNPSPNEEPILLAPSATSERIPPTPPLDEPPLPPPFIPSPNNDRIPLITLAIRLNTAVKALAKAISPGITAFQIGSTIFPRLVRKSAKATDKRLARPAGVSMVLAISNLLSWSFLSINSVSIHTSTSICHHIVQHTFSSSSLR